MPTEANKFRVGLFVFFGAMAVIALVFFYGANRYLHETKPYATYFGESVQGLEPNAPVKFRGLQIGRVERIRLAQDGKLIEVVMQIDRQKYKVKREHIVLLRSANLSGMKYLDVEPRGDRPFDTPALSFTS